MSRRQLILVRHGQYDLDKSKGHHLTELGRVQAHKVASALHNHPSGIDVIYASPLVRAHETAEIIGEKLKKKVIVSDLLREGFPTKYPGYSEEASAEDRARFRKAFGFFSEPPILDQRYLLVCHGNIIRYFVCKALLISISRWIRFASQHASITRITIKNSYEMGLASYNETGHLSPREIT